MRFKTVYTYILASKGVSREMTKEFSRLKDSEIWLSSRNGNGKAIHVI